MTAGERQASVPAAALAAAAIALVAFALRIEDLFQPLVDAFAWREASTAMMAGNLPANRWNPLWPEVDWTGDMPGYQGREFQSLTYAAAALDQLFGRADWHGRLVGALCGTVTTVALYRLVRLVGGEGRALAAAAVYAVMPGAVVVDRSYLPDPAMLALLVAGLWCLAEGATSGGRRWLAAGWLLVTGALLAKLPAAAALPTAGLILAAARTGRPTRPAAVAAAIVTGLAVGAYYAWTIHLGRTTPPFHVAGHGWLWQMGPAVFLRHGFWLDRIAGHLAGWSLGPPVIVLAAAGALLPAVGRTDAALRCPGLAHAWALGGAVFVLVAARELTANPWNLHVLHPVAAIYAGNALAALAAPLSVGRGALLAGAAVAVIAADARGRVSAMKQEVYGTDARLGRVLGDLSCPDDLVITSGSVAGLPVAIHHAGRKGFLFPPPDLAPAGTVVWFPEPRRAPLMIDALAARGARWFGAVKRGVDRREPPRVFDAHLAGLVRDLDDRAWLAYEDDEILVYDLSPLTGARGDCPPPGT